MKIFIALVYYHLLLVSPNLTMYYQHSSVKCHISKILETNFISCGTVKRKLSLTADRKTVCCSPVKNNMDILKLTIKLLYDSMIQILDICEHSTQHIH